MCSRRWLKLMFLLTALTALSGCSGLAGKRLVIDMGMRTYAITLNVSDAQATASAPRPELSEEDGWSYDLAVRLGNQQPTREIVAWISSWQRAEGSPKENFNPLNTTQSAPGATIFNSVGVKIYTSREQGIEATVATLHGAYAGYAEIIAGIVGNDPALAQRGLVASPWETNADDVAKIFNKRIGQDAKQANPGDVRQRLIDFALSLQGTGYSQEWSDSLGFRPDCSGTMAYIYKQVAGIDIGVATWDQYPNLPPIDLKDAKNGTLWYGGNYSGGEQHTGMMWMHDGHWALINNGGIGDGMHVDEDFLSNNYFTDHTMGYRDPLNGGD